ncbi:MAG: FtsQ-type POTRA domain-containing protein [Armatimonadetes bacterium]|nr:FtsQ-type POTRA domain-containing protein [Armatimonadota bacterium]
MLASLALVFAVQDAHATGFSELGATEMMMMPQSQTASIIKEISINGTSHVSKEAILAAMRTRTGQPYVQEQLDADKERIKGLGFFKAVDVRAKPLDATNWQIVVDVTEYAVIKEISINGNHAIPTEDLLKVIPVQKGQVFNLNLLKPTGDAIQNLYSKEGYFARVTNVGPQADQESTLEIDLVEQTVGKVTVTGLTKTRPGVISRIIKTREGDVYNENKFIKDLRKLISTGWFEPGSVRPEAPEEQELGKINLNINVKEARTAQIGAGLQIDPQSSFGGYFKLSDNNFRGTGKGVGVEWLQSTTGGGPSINLSYTDPFYDSNDTTFNFSIYSRLIYRFTGTAFGGNNTPTNDNQYSERRTGSSFTFGKVLRDDLNLNYGARYERINTTGINSKTTTGFIKQDGAVGSGSLALQRNRRDVDTDPSRGDWARVSVEPGVANITEVGGDLQDPGLIGSHTFVRTNLEYRRYWSPQPPRTIKDLDAPRQVLAFRTRFGYIAGTVPFFEQFFAGGADTIRGYPEDRYWGREYWVSTLEYRFPIQRSFNLIGFVDYGGAWNGYDTLNTYTQGAHLHRGNGIGLSFNSPLGPIRLDVGWDENGKSRTHFLIGTSF